jgi:hypothetical protein
LFDLGGEIKICITIGMAVIMAMGFGASALTLL